MAALTNADRAAVAYQLQLDNDQPLGVVKADLRAAVDAADAWADASLAAFNAALPQPARGALSPRQKAWLLSYVVARRFRAS
jgi:hypothetical protein